LEENLSIIPLGGVEEIGLNSTVFEYAQNLIVIYLTKVLTDMVE
jgi:mRNA degradation ribonuclease J1/J2